MPYSEVPNVDAAAVLGDDGNLTIFAVNRKLDEDVCLELDVRSFGKYTRLAQSVLHHEDLKTVNTEENPDNVSPIDMPAQKIDSEKIEIRLGKASWNVIRMTK